MSLAAADTFDVLTWLSQQSIPLIRLDYQGNVESVIGGAGFAMDPAKVQWQIETRNDPEWRLEFSCGLIAAKLRTSLETLRDVVPDSSARQVAIGRTEASLSRLESGSVRTVDELRMVEAGAAATGSTRGAGSCTTTERTVPSRSDRTV